MPRVQDFAGAAGTHPLSLHFGLIPYKIVGSLVPLFVVSRIPS